MPTLPGIAPPGDARLARLEQSMRRGRWVLVVLGVGLPLGLHALFERQARRLDALAEHGRAATATITEIDGNGNAAYEYALDGTKYAWSVKASEAPYPPGQAFAIRYLPEDPSFSRPGAEPAGAAREAAANRSLAQKFEFGVLFFFATNLALLEVKARKLRQGVRWLVSPRAAGRVLALVLIGCALVADLSPEVRVVLVKAFGRAPLGVPVVALVASANVLLLFPYFWVCEHLMKIVFQAAEDGKSISRGGLVVAILSAHRAHPQLARSRWIVLAGFGYFVVLAGAWIAYAHSRGL